MKDARLVIGAVIIKHKLRLSDEETVQQIQESLYLQNFVGLELSAGCAVCPIAVVFEGFHRAIIKAHDGKKRLRQSDPEPPTPLIAVLR